MKILCVCIGNGDRSPFMAEILKQYLNNTKHCNAQIESAGISEVADKGGPASNFIITIAKTIGIDLTEHKRRWVKKIDLSKFDLFICVDEQVAIYLLQEGKVPMDKLYKADIPNPWPSKFMRDYEDAAEKITSAMLRVALRYFS